jgi:hypothetical protein
MPITIRVSGAPTSSVIAIHSSASQKVRICQLKCVSSQVPRA